ncbi:hypothetical protein pb186bvf_004158 [Paramecium bursaria]
MSNFVRPPIRTYEEFDPIFDNSYLKQGPEFSELDQQKVQFAIENAAKYVITPVVPKDIPGLVLRTPQQMRIPSTQRWFRRTTSFERNGLFNWHTPVMNTRILSFSFIFCLGYGFMGFQVSSWNSCVQQDQGEIRNTIYDKLSFRELPPTKLWTRPG